MEGVYFPDLQGRSRGCSPFVGSNVRFSNSTTAASTSTSAGSALFTFSRVSFYAYTYGSSVRRCSLGSLSYVSSLMCGPVIDSKRLELRGGSTTLCLDVDYNVIFRLLPFLPDRPSTFTVSVSAIVPSAFLPFFMIRTERRCNFPRLSFFSSGYGSVSGFPRLLVTTVGGFRLRSNLP